MNTLKSKARWYVYTLSDPLDGSAFYVGKGCANRIHQHEKDAASPKTVCSRKINKIRDIQACGREIGKQFNAFFWDEQAAYDHETDLIEEIGLANLTNVLPGGQKAWERRRVEREQRRQDAPLHVWIGKKDAAVLVHRMSEWFKARGHEGVKFKFTANDPAFKWHAAISDAAYNTLIPSLWERIKKDSAALGVLRERIRPHGVEFA